MRWFAFGVLGILVGCGGGLGSGKGGAGGSAAGGAGGGVPKCIAGDSKSCAGPGACAGYQVCGADETYGACMCGAGGTGGAGGSAAGGTGGAGGSFVPEDVDAGAGWQAIAAGTFTGCVIKNGSASCWGDNRDYQFGTGTKNAEPVLSPVPGVTGLDVRQLAIGGGYACAIVSSGELYCWGTDVVTPLYMPGPTAPIRMFGGQHFKSVSAATFNACGLLEGGAAYCWGNQAVGQAVLGGTPNFDCCADGGRLQYVDGGAPDPMAAQVSGGPWAMVSAGYGRACGVDLQGNGFCWGSTSGSSAYAGALGDGDVSPHDAARPVAVVGGHKFKWIRAGAGTSTYALGTDDTPYCWGCDEIRAGAPPLRHADPFPMTFPTGTVIADVTGGAFASCALATDGAVYCWGTNAHGELGIGSADTMSHPTPARVINLPRIAGIASGPGTCALSMAGNRYCWGYNQVGFLGSGATEDIYTPRVLP